jgi:stage II sporulation protein P
MVNGSDTGPVRTAKTALWLIGLHVAVLAVVGAGLILQEQWLKQPFFSVKGVAPSVSSRLFADMLRLELPMFAVNDGQKQALSGDNVLAFLVQLLTDVNPRDRHTLIAGVLPGIRDEAVPLKGQLGRIEAPIDYAPPPGLFERQNGAGETVAEPPVETTERPASASEGTEGPGGGLPPKGSDAGGLSGSSAGETGGAEAPSAPATSGGITDAGVRPDTGGKKVVFIYHSHNRESWVPELKDKGITAIADAFDAEINITLVGKHLADRLEELGIGAVHSDTDYFTSVKNYNWNFSYKYSEKTVEAALREHRDLTFLFDIHRDSQRRDITTAEIDGESYAQVYFIIGRRNPNWKANEAFAGKLHDALERLKPGISRGIWGKGASGENGEYNQSFSDNSVLIEIGGPENTLEEALRTAEVLAKAIADVYWEAERVSGDG